MSAAELLLVCILGLVGVVLGATGSLLGVGGGFILMPILLLLRPGEPAERLTALSLAMILSNAVSASVGYWRQGRVDARAGLIFAGAALPGAVLGAWAIDLIPRRGFDPAFAGMLVVLGVFLVWRGDGRARAGGVDDQPGDVPAAKPDLRLGAGISTGVGFLASLMGIGGGIIHVPALVHLARFTVHAAAATSMFVLAFTSAAAVGVLALRGALDGQWDQAAALGVGAAVGAQIGTRIARRTRAGVIVRLLGGAAIIVGAQVAWRALAGAG